MLNTFTESVLQQFSSSVSVLDITFSLLTAFAISVFILLVYKKTFSGVVYNKNLVLSVVMLSLVTSLIIRTINSNLSLSLGMVGALSIVRFRTAVKEPLDTAYMFWAITAGIMSGVGLYFAAIAGSVLLGLLFYVFYTFGFTIGTKNQYLLVVNYNLTNEDKVKEKLAELPKLKLKNKTVVGKKTVEATYEAVVENEGFVTELTALTGVNSAALVDYKNEIGL